jgi:hypothetical protein
MFPSSHTTPGLSYAAAVLRNNTQHQQEPHPPPTVAHACPATVGKMSALPPLRHNQQQIPNQSVQAPNVNNSSLIDMFKVVTTLFQQIMTELNGAKSEENRIVPITKIVLKLMKQTGC